MADELVNQDTDIINIINEKSVGELLNPLIREIYLFDSYVAGTTHLQDPSVLKKVKVDDKLVLKREENKFDQKAILILTADGEKLGYVPEKDNIVFSRLMDAGKMLSAKISDINQRNSYTQIKIKIFLIDF